MIAEVAPILVDVGTVAGIIVAGAAAVGALSRASAVRWLWRALIGDPITRWSTRVVADQVDPLRAEMSTLSAALVAHMGDEIALRQRDAVDRDRRQDEMGQWRDEIRGDVAAIREDANELKAGLGTVHRRVDTALELLADGNPEIRRDPPA